MLATAYGAYQYSLSPAFNSRVLAFLDAGGIYVVANVRGGGEFGRDWHKAGQKATKPNTWRDFIDVSRALITARVTTSERLVILGTSAGGIAVGRALTEQPDLFAGAIADVGFMNPLRYSAEQNNLDIDEWGPIVDAPSFRAMYEMDSYHAIKDGTHYPPVLVISGSNDPRVPPSMPRSSSPACRRPRKASRPSFFAWTSKPATGWAARESRGMTCSRISTPSRCGALAQDVLDVRGEPDTSVR